MRKAYIGAIIATAFALAACEPQPQPPGNNGDIAAAPAPAPNDPTRCGLTAGTLVDEKTLYGAETAYNVVAHAYVTLDGAGKLSAASKATVRPHLIKAYDALKLARSAYKVGDVCGLKGYAESVTDLASHAKALLPPG